MKTMIVAYDNERTIGRGGDLPWRGRMKADADHFVRITSGASVIMGRKTYESIPERFRPLKNRQNIVLTRLGMEAINGVTIAHTLEEAYAAAESDIMIIGGGQVYEQALRDVDVVLATEIDTVVDDGDTYFPELSEDEWLKRTSASRPRNDNNRFAYTFALYTRRFPNSLSE